jgi:hypothetical protein
MIKAIIENINQYPYIAIITLLILTIICVHMYNFDHKTFLKYKKQEETFESVSISKPEANCGCGPNSFDPLQIFEPKFVGINKKIKFKCVVDGKEYYLVSMSIASSPTCNGKANDQCKTNFLALMDTKTMEKNEKEYNANMNDKIATCEFSEKLKCKRQSEVKSEAEESNEKSNNKCVAESLEKCTYPKRFNNEFSIYRSPNTDTKNPEFLIAGTGVPFNDSKAQLHLLNQYASVVLFNDAVCMDLNDINDMPTKVSLVFTEQKHVGGIHGGDNKKISFKIKFNTPQFKDKKPIMENEKQSIKARYIGLCKDQSCKTAESEYKKVCLLENAIDSNVLEFQAIL